MRFKRILCGVDFSQVSVNAYETAVEFARSWKAQLHIMHVIEADPRPLEWLPQPEPSNAVTSLQETARAAMEALVGPSATALDGLTVTSEVTNGRAPDEILNRARDLEIDLIILGDRGLTLPEETFSGGAAERVMKGAACSVLIVRD